MTTITIDRSLLEQALVALSAPNHCVFSEPPICVDIRAALAASATAPEPMFWVRIRSDGMYEGPLHNAQIEKVRKESGSWRPLYMHPPAHQEQLKPGECWPERIMKQWDEMRDLISKGDKSSLPRDWFESLAEMRLIDAPTTAWHDAPTCAGVWICDEGDICYTWTANNIEILDQFDPGEGLRWYGPIPPDGDKP